MQFERVPDAPNSVRLSFEPDERKILNDAILDSFVQALEERDNGVPLDPNFINVGRVLLHSSRISVTGVRAYGEQVQFLSDVVSDYLRDVPANETEKVTALAAGLGAAARLVADETPALRPSRSEDEIDQIVAAFEIPDYLNGFGT